MIIDTIWTIAYWLGLGTGFTIGITTATTIKYFYTKRNEQEARQKCK